MEAATDILVELAHDDYGFYAGAGASALEHEAHYASVWGRDAAYTIIGLGACDHLEGYDPRRQRLVRAAEASLSTLLERQYANGQIPNVVWPVGNADTGGEPYFDCGETGGVDATSLFVIALGDHLVRHPGSALQRRVADVVPRALDWLLARDSNQEGIIDSPQAGDWMDSTLVRGGKTLYNNVLLYRALRVGADLLVAADLPDYAGLAADLKERINFAFWPVENENWRFMIGPLGAPGNERRRGAYPHPARQAAYTAAYSGDRAHYLSHIEYAEFVDKCDVLGNVLAVLFGVADAERSRLVMSLLYEHSRKLACPISVYLEPIAVDDPSHMYKREVEQFQGERWRNPPGSYHNAGIWPFVGGLYISALAKVRMTGQAQSELQRLAKSCVETDFNEWLDFYSGAPGGNPRQAWSAATFLGAASATQK